MTNKSTFVWGCLSGLIVSSVLLLILGSPIGLWEGSRDRQLDPDAVREADSSYQANELSIVRARYGANDAWIDVTKQITNKVKNKTLLIQASNAIAGDPLPGVPKSLVVEYEIDGERKSKSVREGGFLRIPELKPIDSPEELLGFVKKCPAEIGFFGKNFTTGATIEHRPDQPACLASIVKIFTLLEVARQTSGGKLALSDPVSIRYRGKRLSCSIDDALDLMIGLSDNAATDALTAHVGYDKVNSLPKSLGIAGLSDQILPAPGVLAEVLNKRVRGDKVVQRQDLLPQHGTARGIVEYFELLDGGKLLRPAISKEVLAVLDRNPKNFVPNAPDTFKIVGKGGSLSWQPPGEPQYNRIGWGWYLRDGRQSLAFCLWCEWFPHTMKEETRRKWCYAISDGIVNVLLDTQKKDASQPDAPAGAKKPRR